MRYKYPRTLHLPWSLGATKDDRILNSINHFVGREVVVTEKMDGENTSICRDGLYARSVDSRYHLSQSFVRTLQGNIGWQLPERVRLCGENLYAKHSIYYTELKSYFYLFSIWENDNCLSWDDTLDWAQLLGIDVVPILWRGIWDEQKVKSCIKNKEKQEGYVVRAVNSFSYNNFPSNLAKFVRSNHVQTDKHWKSQQIVPNQLKRN